MNVPASMTIASAERLLAGISQGGADRLLIPTRGRHQHLGGEGAFVQAFTTWANRVPDAVLATYAEGPDDAVQLERIAARLYGMVAALGADRVVDHGNADITVPLKRLARDRLKLMQGPKPADASRGPQIEVVCADHLGLGSPSTLYQVDHEGISKLRRIDAFNAFARMLIATTVTREMMALLPADLDRSIGAALHELFRNTDEHALADDAGNAPRKSLRGIHARRQSITPESLEALAADSPPLADYCTALRPARAGNRDIQLVEISVFDSGPGMGPRWARKRLGDLSPEDELAAVRACFGKHASSKSTSFSGLGLPNVIHSLRAGKGFLRLRTGRQALYADLAAEGPQAFGTEPDLRAWPSAVPAVPAVGTLFTLVFPLEERE